MARRTFQEEALSASSYEYWDDCKLAELASLIDRILKERRGKYES